MIHVTEKDIEALIEYVHGKALEYHGMTYADGIRDMVDWLVGEGDRPDVNE